MGRGPTKSNENVYFVARKKAAMYNERLYSREGAAELLGISVSTLADYELGNTKVVPVDKVVLMADLYNAPELKTGYCKYECPICSYLPVVTEAKGLEGITLRLMKRLDCDELNRIKKELVDIMEDGIIDETEKPELKKILAFLDEVAEPNQRTEDRRRKVFKEGVSMDVQKMLEILKRDYGIESKEELIERFESSKGINIGIFTERRQTA